MSLELKAYSTGGPVRETGACSWAPALRRLHWVYREAGGPIPGRPGARRL